MCRNWNTLVHKENNINTMANKNVIWCDAETLTKDISGKTYIVTGANSGVGLETTRQLVKQGGHVVMACRRVDAGKEAARSFAGLKGSHEVMRCDLADLQSVRDFADDFLSSHSRLDGLVCNAGLCLSQTDSEQFPIIFSGQSRH